MTEIRALERHEVAGVWTIDRSETIESQYVVRNGRLERTPCHFELRGWPAGETEIDTPRLLACFDRGGASFGAFDRGGMIGAAFLDTIGRGERKDLRQLLFLHVGRRARGQGLGTDLFRRCRHAAREAGARGLYISATATENTVAFYLRRGCRLVEHPDPELFALEPEDIHLSCPA